MKIIKTLHPRIRNTLPALGAWRPVKGTPALQGGTLSSTQIKGLNIMRIFALSLALLACSMQIPAAAAAKEADWKFGPNVTGVNFSMSENQLRKVFEAEFGPLKWRRSIPEQEALPDTKIIFRRSWIATTNGGDYVRYMTDLKGQLMEISRTEKVTGDSAEQVVRPAEQSFGEPFSFGHQGPDSYSMIFGMTTQGERLTDTKRGWATCDTDKLWDVVGPLPDCQWALHVHAFKILNSKYIERNIKFYHAQRLSQAYEDALRRAKRGNF